MGNLEICEKALFANFIAFYNKYKDIDFVRGAPTNMRAEIESLVSEIQQSLELLRRHL